MRTIKVEDLAVGQVELDEEWQYASPSGGFVTSDFWPRFNVERGHVVRVKGTWSVVQDIQRNAGSGVWHFITWAGCLCVYSRFDGVQVRTDYRLTVAERDPECWELDDDRGGDYAELPDRYESAGLTSTELDSIQAANRAAGLPTLVRADGEWVERSLASHADCDPDYPDHECPAHPLSEAMEVKTNG